MTSKKQPTIYDIAEYLGISSGTVYRALNNKGRVSEQTRSRVLEAASVLGYKVNKAAQSLRRSPITIGAVLCCPVYSYLEDIRLGMKAAFDELRQFNVFADICDLGSMNAEDCEADVLAALDRFAEKGYQGVILFLSGNNAPFVEKINALAGAGIRIATVANDAVGSARNIYVSADGHAAGMLAAEILSLCCAGKHVAILTGSRNTAIHRSNISGFYAYADAHASFASITTYEHSDDEAIARKKIDDLMRSAAPPDGMYITSAISQCICQYTHSLRPENPPRIIMTDLFEESRRLLASGAACATIFQDPFKQGKRVVMNLFNYIVENKTGEECNLLIPQAVFASNMQLYDRSLL